MFVFVVVYVIYMKTAWTSKGSPHQNVNGTQGQELKAPEYILFFLFLINKIRNVPTYGYQEQKGPP
jgi:hypothetical protein